MSQLYDVLRIKDATERLASTINNFWIAIDGDDYATAHKASGITIKSVLGVTDLETTVNQLAYNSTYVVDSYNEMLLITGMTNGQGCYVRSTAQRYTYDLANTAWLSDSPQFTQTTATKISQQFADSYTTISEQTSVANNSLFQNTHTINLTAASDFTLDQLSLNVYSTRLAEYIQSIKIINDTTLQEVEVLDFVLLPNIEREINFTTPLNISSGDDYRIVISDVAGVALNGLSPTVPFYKVSELAASTYTEIEAAQFGAKNSLPSVAPANMPLPATGDIILFRDSTNSDNYSLLKNVASAKVVVDLESGGGGGTALHALQMQVHYWFNTLNVATGGTYLDTISDNVEASGFQYLYGKTGKTYQLVDLTLNYSDENSEQINVPTVDIYRDRGGVLTKMNGATPISISTTGFNDLLSALTTNSWQRGDQLRVMGIGGTGTPDGSSIHFWVNGEWEEVI